VAGPGSTGAGTDAGGEGAEVGAAGAGEGGGGLNWPLLLFLGGALVSLLTLRRRRGAID